MHIHKILNCQTIEELELLKSKVRNLNERVTGQLHVGFGGAKTIKEAIEDREFVLIIEKRR